MNVTDGNHEVQNESVSRLNEMFVNLLKYVPLIHCPGSVVNEWMTNIFTKKKKIQYNVFKLKT